MCVNSRLSETSSPNSASPLLPRAAAFMWNSKIIARASRFCPTNVRSQEGPHSVVNRMETVACAATVSISVGRPTRTSAQIHVCVGRSFSAKPERTTTVTTTQMEKRKGAHVILLAQHVFLCLRLWLDDASSLQPGVEALNQRSFDLWLLLWAPSIF